MPRDPRTAARVDAGDDAAILADGTTITVDTLVEGIHFTQRTSPRDLAHKALAVSVSDIVSMGARPSSAVLSLSLPHYDPAWLDAFAEGLAKACAAYGVQLVGGDTTGSPGPIVISMTVLGTAPLHPWLRSGAQPGDILAVTGTLGDAGAGWMLSVPWPEALEALDRPMPPVAFALALVAAQVVVHAAMDLSDGLAADLPRMCAASGVGAVVDPAALPASAAVARHAQRLALQVCGGEDYQLLLAVPPNSWAELLRVGQATDTPVTRIGLVVAGDGAQLDGVRWPKAHFAHFAGPQA